MPDRADIPKESRQESPEENREGYPRSAVAISAETCTGCGLCVIACPADVIRFDAATGKARVVYGRDCQVCYLCEDDCPTHSITLSHDVTNSRRFSIYDEFGIDLEQPLLP